MKPARIVVIGSVNTDLFMHLDRLPRPGETIRLGSFRQQGGGKGANLAIAAARLGAHVTLVAAVGNDEAGRNAIAELLAAGVDVSRVRVAGVPTGTAMIMVDRQGENMIGVDAGANELLSRSDVEAALADPELADPVVIANLEVPLEPVRTASTIARDKGWPFVLNPAPPRELDSEIIDGCALMTPNIQEVGRLGYRSAVALLAAGAHAVVVTRGADGADLLRPGLPTLHQDPFPVDSVDSTGSGDAFSAALSCALAEGLIITDALRRAAAAGAVAARTAGARVGIAIATEIDSLVACPDIGKQHITGNPASY